MAVIQGQANVNDVGGIKSAYGGYAGWNDPNAIVADFNATGGAGKGGPTNPSQPAAQPQAQPQAGGGTPAPATGAVNPNDANSIKASYSGYAGWNDPAAIVADFKATGGAGKGGPTAPGGGGIGNMFNQPTIDLQGISDTNDRLFAVHDQQRAITDSTDTYNKQMAAINDNPYLSAADLVGRGEKLTNAFNADIKNKQDALAMATADSQAKTALATQQFNINSQQAQQAFSMANTLLANGALDSASGADIAQLVKATGIPSSIWQSAIATQTTKDTPTSVTTADDGVHQSAVVMNTKTGAIIATTILGPSQQTKPSQLVNIGGTLYNVVTDPHTGQVVSKTALGPAPSTGGGGSSTAQNTQTETASAASLVKDYINSHQAQSMQSPETFIANLLLAYPEAAAFINANYTAKQIRQITGQ